MCMCILVRRAVPKKRYLDPQGWIHILGFYRVFKASGLAHLCLPTWGTRDRGQKNRTKDTRWRQNRKNTKRGAPRAEGLGALGGSASHRPRCPRDFSHRCSLNWGTKKGSVSMWGGRTGSVWIPQYGAPDVLKTIKASMQIYVP